MSAWSSLFSPSVSMLQLSDTRWRHPLIYHQCCGHSPPPAGCEHAGLSDQWPPCSHHLRGTKEQKRWVHLEKLLVCMLSSKSKVWWESLIVLPLGTTISASLMVGSMYCSKAGFTNLLYCLMTPSMSRPRSVMSLRSRRTSRMSESASTKIFISRSCRWGRANSPERFNNIHFSKAAAQTTITVGDCFASLQKILQKRR